MISFFAILLRLFFKIFRSNRTILSENALLKKEKKSCCNESGGIGFISTYTTNCSSCPEQGSGRQTLANAGQAGNIALLAANPGKAALDI
jgi:hypothetical protein